MNKHSLIGALLLLAGPALANEQAITLKPGDGLDTVQANCGACHSLDYIVMNSPFPTAAVWDAEVTKMVKTFGAPITDADSKKILDYLVKAYSGKP
jgi:sulfite dehydrogenase (cytochrome) subunit B